MTASDTHGAPAAPEPDKSVVDRLLRRHGRGFAEELGLDLAGGTPSALYCWLNACLLLSARISARVAMRAAAALIEEGWTTPEALLASRWEDRVRALDRAGYARYDERTARMLADAAALLVERYGGDLRALRRAAGGDGDDIRARLKAFKGIGDAGADIFRREVQGAWEELYPFADGKALDAAARLGLPDSAAGLAALTDKTGFPRLLAALVRTDLARDYAAMAGKSG